MTGWRIGYLAAPARLVDQAAKSGQNTITNVAPFAQKAALAALSSSEVAETTREMNRKYEQRRDLALSLFRNTPGEITAIRPQGAFYLFLDVHSLNQPSAELANRLLEETLVSMVPGIAFGKCGEGFLRATFAASEHAIETGLRRLIDWANS
jgi:aspartate/methionine/tyrosine aminotransferase